MGSLFGAFSGGGPPTLQLGPSCAAAGRGAVVFGRNKEACLADETTAQETLKQNWSKYPATDKTICSGMTSTGGPASYVELLSCLEILRDAKSIEATDPSRAVTWNRARALGKSPTGHESKTGLRTAGAGVPCRSSGQPCWRPRFASRTTAPRPLRGREETEAS
jgi:hypothetical protein